MKISDRARAKALTILLLASIGLIATPFAAGPVAGTTSSGQVIITPAVTQVQSTGSIFTIQVKVANIGQFNTYDVQVTTDPSVINATSLSVNGNIFYQNASSGIILELTHCINGSGSGCAPQKGDGPGVVHSSMTDAGHNVNASGSGLLFTITYHVVSAKAYSPIAMQNATAIIAIAGHKVDHATVSGQYGEVPPPDFTLSPSPESMIIQQGSSNYTTITLTSLNNFAGIVNVTLTFSEPSVTVTITRNQTLLKSNGSNSTILTVSASASASATSFDIIISGTSGTLTPPPLTIPIKILVTPDFQPGAFPADLRTHQASGNSTLIFVTSINGFTGTVKLRVQAPEGTLATFDQTGNSTASISVPAYGNANTTLRIMTQSSLTPFRDTFGINATSGSISHPLYVTAEPPLADFNVIATPTYASILAGDTTTVKITLTSLDYYWGAIYELGTTQSGLGFTFEHGNFTLNWGQTASSTLRITTDPTTAAGNYTVTVVVFGIEQLNGASTKHIIDLNFRVSALPIAPVSRVRTFLGLNAPEFFGIIITLIAALAVLGGLESRRPRQRRKRTILTD